MAEAIKIEERQADVNYYDKIVEFFKTNDFWEAEIQKFFTVYLQLRDKKSDYWFYTALTLKGASNWTAYGFGLFFNEKFIQWVDKKVEQAELNYQTQNLSVDDLFARYRRDDR